MTSRPFPSVPSLVGYLSTTAHHEAAETILRCVRRDEGVATLVAAPGLGKSTLAMRLQVALEDQFEVVRLASGHCGSRRALLQAISYELGLPHRNLEEGELRIQLAEYIEQLDSQTIQGVVILVDEADLLPIRLLEELRLLTNLAHDQRSRVSVVLLGNMNLEERLSSPHLASFNQRIGARAYLQPMTQAETAQYIQLQLHQSGVKRTIFDESAVETIFAKTQGVPRVVNQLCDHTLLLASLGEVRHLSGIEIEESWADLQRLPMPQRTIRTDAAHQSDSLIEFGSLDDADQSEAAEFDSSEDANDFPAVVRFEERSLPIESNILAEEEFSPDSDQQPEVELVFQSATNPFEETFDDEEVVIDHYASLGDQALDGIHQVTSPSNSEIAAFLIGSESRSAEVNFVQPESSSEDQLVVSRDYSTFETGFTSSDDRDIIVIDQAEAKEATPKLPEPKRRTYRQLFSQLRREQA